jgi:hypothetical protein
MYDNYGELGAQQSLTLPFTIDNTKKTIKHQILVWYLKREWKPRL